MLADDRRRSARARLRVPLRLGWSGDGCLAETEIVSQSGALVLIPEPLLPGLILEIENRLTGETARVRVVSCSRETDAFGCWEVGVALLSQQSGFFRIPEAAGLPRAHERRRSRRVSLAHPVELVREREAFRGRTRTVNRHGALVLSPRGWPAGEPLWVRNLVSGRARPARVVRSGPALSIPGPGFDVALEFEEPPPGFWSPDYDGS